MGLAQDHTPMTRLLATTDPFGGVCGRHVRQSQQTGVHSLEGAVTSFYTFVLILPSNLCCLLLPPPLSHTHTHSNVHVACSKQATVEPL